MKNVAGMLFVTFRGLNCVMETRSLKECSSTLLSSMYICSYFAVFVGIKMVIGAMSERQKRDHAVSWEKLIIMKHVNIRHKVNGLFLTLTAIVGMFLFCLMESADDDTTDRAKTATMVWILGLIGTMSVIISILTETFVLPKRNDKKHKAFLIGHFVQFAVVSELIAVIGNIRAGRMAGAVFNLLRIPLYCLGLRLIFRLREALARLPANDLSDFLVFTFSRGGECLVTITFFLLEDVTCWIEELDDERCTNTNASALYLSVIVLMATLTSIVRRSSPKEVRDEVAMTKERLALFHLSRAEQVQFSCIFLTAIAALILLSNLGVPGKENAANSFFGMGGFICFAVVFVIEARSLIRAEKVRMSGGYRPNQFNIFRMRAGSRHLSSGGLSKSSRFGEFV
ncbi:hypothetical protein TrRE_jg10544 [Triparma retinervis]|uniref:Uncharacterized protein n=1 Tax=Triparma retinervis TaxID=2557542 RepID=A0A9W7DWI2_9STRA|nr:hypothetical protein TrRE_jg10544 [Triparma retinervis]